MRTMFPYSPQLSAALRLVRKLEEGFVVAPRDPSLEMLAAGAESAQVSPQLAARIYEAMIRRL